MAFTSLIDESEFNALRDDASAKEIVEAAIRTTNKRREKLGNSDPLLHSLVGPLSKRLGGVEPFLKWQGFRLYYDEARQGEKTESAWAQWIVLRIEDGWTAQQIVERAQHWINANAAEFHDVFVISGLELEKSIQLHSHVYLCRPEELSGEFWNEKKLFDTAKGPVDDAGVRSALVVPYLLKPMAGPPAGLTDEEAKDFFRAKTMPFSPRMEREYLATLARLALILAGNGPLELVAHYTTPADADYPSPLAPSLGRFDYPALPRRNSQVDISIASEMLEKLIAFRDSRPLRLAISRMARARHEHGADAAIDLGTAIDVMVRHDDSSQGDVAAKVKGRVALLLKNPALADHAEALFEARSIAVHRGELPFPSNFSVEEAQNVCVEVARAILRKGAFPNWTELGERDWKKPKSMYERLCVAWDKASPNEKERFKSRIEKRENKS